ncbi:hypothetical protein GGF41_004422, partial [Coemansia sp. RSA 2531]
MPLPDPFECLYRLEGRRFTAPPTRGIPTSRAPTPNCVSSSLSMNPPDSVYRPRASSELGGGGGAVLLAALEASLYAASEILLSSL